MPFQNFYNKRIYLDLDGVLCDFNTQFLLMTKTGHTAQKYVELYGAEEMIEEVKKRGQEFFATMPWKKDGELLYNYCKKYRPIILTSYIDTEECRLGKTQWVQNFLQPKTEVIFTNEKEIYADEYSILIDDNGRTVRSWIKKGGEGIRHTSSIETIKELKKRGL